MFFIMEGLRCIFLVSTSALIFRLVSGAFRLWHMDRANVVRGDPPVDGCYTTYFWFSRLLIFGCLTLLGCLQNIDSAIAEDEVTVPESQGLTYHEYIVHTPPHPVNLLAIPSGLTDVELHWDLPIPPPSGTRVGYSLMVSHYVILRADGEGAFKKVGISNTTSYTDKTAKKGVLLRYVVIAVQEDKSESGFSNEVLLPAFSR